jgi:hypothetical protein
MALVFIGAGGLRLDSGTFRNERKFGQRRRGASQRLHGKPERQRCRGGDFDGERRIGYARLGRQRRDERAAEQRWDECAIGQRRDERAAEQRWDECAIGQRRR